jgi:lipoic acid synthetase
VRPQADYERSLAVLARAADRGLSLVKTGIMVGLGETEDEVQVLLRDVAGAGVDVVTIGQYLRPSAQHARVVEYVRPEVFSRYAASGGALGLQVHAAPFVRSSFHAGESLVEARRARNERPTPVS